MKKYAGHAKLARQAVSASRLPYVLRAAHVTEKATSRTQDGCYTFKVHVKATKNEIRQAVSSFFKVDVVSVNTLNMPARSRNFRGIKGCVSAQKKAMVTLKKGQVIDAEKGVA